MNGQSAFGDTAALALTRRKLGTIQQVVLLALAPMVFFAVHFSAAMPLYNVPHSATNPLIIALDNLLTVLLAVGRCGCGTGWFVEAFDRCEKLWHEDFEPPSP